MFRPTTDTGSRASQKFSDVLPKHGKKITKKSLRAVIKLSPLYQTRTTPHHRVPSASGRKCSKPVIRKLRGVTMRAKAVLAARRNFRGQSRSISFFVSTRGVWRKFPNCEINRTQLRKLRHKQNMRSR